MPAPARAALASPAASSRSRTASRAARRKIQDLVGTVVGVGRVRAQVTAQVSFDQVDATTETFNPDGQVPQTEQRSEGGPADGGTPQTIVSNQYQELAPARGARTSRAAHAHDRRRPRGRKAMRAGEAKQLPGHRVHGAQRRRRETRAATGSRCSRGAVRARAGRVGDKEPRSRSSIPSRSPSAWSHPFVGVVAIVVMLLIALQLKNRSPPKRSPLRPEEPA